MKFLFASFSLTVLLMILLSFIVPFIMYPFVTNHLCGGGFTDGAHNCNIFEFALEGPGFLVLFVVMGAAYLLKNPSGLFGSTFLFSAGVFSVTWVIVHFAIRKWLKGKKPETT